MFSSAFHFFSEDKKEKIINLFFGKKKCSFTLSKIVIEQKSFILIWEYFY